MKSPSSNGTSPHALRLLILEDNPADVELIKAELRRGGITAKYDVAATREKYIAGLKRVPDAILSDVNVPQFGGREALELLGETGLDIPLVLVSGAIGEEGAVDLVKLGAVDYILKDRLARLPQALTQAVHGASLRRDKRADAEALRVVSLETAKVVRQQHEQYRHLFAKNPSPMWVFDLTTLKILAANEAATLLYGYSAEEFLKLSLADMRPAEDLPDLMQAVSKETVGPRNAGIWRHLRKDGSLLSVEVHSSAVEFEGKPARMSIMLDVTERLAAEEKLRASEGRLQTIIDHEPQCVKTVSADGHVLAMNPAGLKMIEADDFASIKGRSIMGLIHPDDREAFEQLHRDVSQGHPGQLQFRIIGLKGRERWMETHSVALPEGKSANSVLSVTRDITEQRAAEDSVRIQASMLDQIGQSVIATDSEGKITYTNRFAGELYGWQSGAEVRGKNIREVTVPRHSREQADEIMASLALGEKWSGEFVCRRLDGSEFEAFCTTSPLLGADGKLAGVVGTSTDITKMKEVEATLRMSESKLANAQRIAHLGHWECDIRTGEITWSVEVCRIFGISLENCRPTAETFFAIIHPADRDAVRAASETALAGGAAYSIDHRVIRADGSEAVVHQEAEVTFSETGEALRMAGTVQDITARKKTEEKLQEAEEKYRSIFENASEGIFRTSREGKVLVANPAAARLLGFESAEEFIQMRSDLARQGYVDPERRSQFKEAIGKDGLVRGFESEVYRKDGSTICISETARMVRDAAGEVLYFEGTFEDITERKRAETALMRLAAIVESSDDAIISEDLEGIITSWNGGAERIFGYAAKEVVGSSITRLLPDDRLEEKGEFLAQIKRGVVVNHFETLRLTKDGRRIDVSVTASPIKDSAGRVVGISKVAHDITERRKTEAARDRLAAVLETTTDLVSVNDPAGNLLYLNGAGRDLLGVEASEDIRAFSLSDFLPHPASHPMLTEGLPTAARAGTWSGEVVLAGRMGQGIPVSQVILAQKSDSGEIESYSTIMRDVTERRREEKVLAESERRFRFLNHLSEATRSLSDPREIMATVTRLLGVHLGVSRCAYAEVTADGERVLIRGDYVDGCASLVGEHRFSAFGPHAGAELHAGRVLLVNDVNSEVPAAEGGDAYRAAEIQALIACPLIKDGRLIGAVAVYHLHPRCWAADEIALVQEVAERCWSIIQSARAEIVLRESEEHLRLVIAASNDGVFEQDYSTNVLDWSDRLYEMMGLERNSFVPTVESFGALLHPDDKETFEESVRDQMANGGRYTSQLRLRRADGSYGNFLSRGHGVLDAAGRPSGLIGCILDLTTLAQAEQKVVEQAALLDLAHDAIMVHSMDGRVLYWNHGAETLYGWTSADALGREAGSFLFHDDPASLVEARTALLDRGQWSGESKHFRKDGEVVLTRSRWTLVRDDHGQPKAMLIINTDITEQKKIEEQFLRAQRLESIGTLASGVAHDLNNILSPILMAVPLLQGELPEKLKNQIIATIEQSAERGAQIVKQVLTFARGLDGERVLIDPSHLLKEMSQIAEQTFPKSIRVSCRYPENLWLVEADPTQMHQILLNLSVNARDAMPKGGTLTLSADNVEVDEHYASMTPGAKPGLHVVLTAADSGSGMPREVIDKIFDPFFTTKVGGMGTGLGLSTVLGIVRSHGGFISVYSEPGNGTTFKVYLPASSGTLAEVESLSATPNGNHETILVIDDEPAIVAVTKLILESHNYRVLTAEDGPEALALFAQNMDSIDVVMTDLMMPFMDGEAVVRSLRKMKPGIPVIASTGQGASTHSAALKSLGVTICLSKPYDRGKLLKTLHEVVAHGTEHAGRVA